MSGLFQAGQKAGLTNVVQLRSKRVFSTFPSGRNEKTPLGSNSTTSVSYHHFDWAFPSRAKSRVDERRPIAFKTRFFDFPHRGETKKHPWERIPRRRFHTTIFPLLFQAGQKAGLTNVVQLRSKRVFSTFAPSGRNEKTPLGSNSTTSVSYHHFEWAFPSRAKSRVDERRPIAFKTRFFDFPHRGETKKHPWDSNSTTSVSYHHFEWAFPSRAKSRVDERRPIAFKTRFFDFPIGAKRKTPLGSNSTTSVSYHHFEWAFPSRAKSRVDERRPIAFKTRFFDFPHRGETKKHP